MKAKHTPGPWEAVDGQVRWPGCKNRAGKRNGSSICYVGSPGANELLTLTGTYGSYELARAIQAANARLIAAAPALLERIKARVDACPCGKDGQMACPECNTDINLIVDIEGEG